MKIIQLVCPAVEVRKSQIIMSPLRTSQCPCASDSHLGSRCLETVADSHRLYNFYQGGRQGSRHCSKTCHTAIAMRCSALIAVLLVLSMCSRQTFPGCHLHIVSWSHITHIISMLCSNYINVSPTLYHIMQQSNVYITCQHTGALCKLAVWWLQSLLWYWQPHSTLPMQHANRSVILNEGHQYHSEVWGQKSVGWNSFSEHVNSSF